MTQKFIKHNIDWHATKEKDRKDKGEERKLIFFGCGKKREPRRSKKKCEKHPTGLPEAPDDVTTAGA